MAPSSPRVAEMASVVEGRCRAVESGAARDVDRRRAMGRIGGRGRAWQAAS